MKLVVLCPYPPHRAPSQRLKFEQYYASWGEAGFQVDVRPFWDEEGWRVLHRRGYRAAKAAALLRGMRRRRRDLRVALDADLVYLHLEAAPLGPPVMERRIAAAGVPLVYDVDDLVHLPHASRANPFMRRLRGGHKVFEVMEMASHVVVCTEHLAEVARRHAARVTNISSTVDTDVYRPRPHRDRTAGVVVGWSGSHSTSPYLHLLDDVLRVLQREDGVGIRVIGDAGYAVDGLEAEALPWRLETEVADLSAIDIGVYPLPHEEWVLGKSGLKAIQYMGLAIPTVAESVGAARDIVDHGRTGFLATGAEAWLQALRRLVRDPALRRRIGEAGRETVEARYSVRANAPRYLAVLREAVADR